MPKTRILFTIPNFRTAGSQYVLLSLYRRIDKTVFDPYICVEKPFETFPDEIPADRQLNFLWTNNTLQDILHFRSFLGKHKIDIVHSWDYKSNYLEALASKFAGVNYLYTKKNNSWSRPWKLKSFFSKHIAYDNPAMKDRFFGNFLFRNKITFIPHGVDTDIFKPMEKTPRETFNIGCIGNIGSNKNQLFIVEALKGLPENVVLHLYGNEDKDYRDKLDQYINSNNLNGRVYFHGYIANIALPEVYRNIDLFVLASFQEGLPVSILEAMACGVPVLSSDSGGGAKYLLNPAYIFSLENPSELIDKILRFYNMENTEKQRLAALGRLQVCKEHALEKEITNYEKLYKKLVKS